jgi:hypothetical protein
MSRPPKTDFRSLIAGNLAPEPETPTSPELSPAAAPALEVPTPTHPREVVSLKSRRAAPIQKPVGEGTLKERAHQLSLYLEGPVYDQLRDIAHVELTKLHPLILEGIDLLLKKRGAPSIKELTKAAG